MARSPFRIMRPFTVSFSGGRTSAYMLRRILDAYGGVLPPDAFVLFANTGKERDETLDFVHEVETRWGVPIRWLEYRAGRQWAEVDYATAHRTAEPGSPFEALINDSTVLPNPVARNCTQTLKIKVMRWFLISQGWDRDFHRRDAIGIRADESDRTFGISADKPAYVTPEFPLISAGITEPDVMRFWRKQSFDLKLGQHEGNCDLCFLKSRRKLAAIIRGRPELADWWVRMEAAKGKGGGSGYRFRDDRTYLGLIDAARQGLMFDDMGDDDEIPCTCAAGPGDWADDGEDRS